MMTQKTPKNAFKFICESCDFKCCNKKDFKRHMSTDKHKMMTNDDKKTPKNPTAFMCSCGKSYKYRQGLSVHKKKCLQIKDGWARSYEHVLTSSATEQYAILYCVTNYKDLYFS